jgi:hypothetical protein
MIDIQLRAFWVEGVGYRYDTLLRGEVIVRASRDSEFETARVLKCRGLRGRFRTIDFFTERPRIEHDIEKAAGLCTVERDDTGLLIVPYRPMSDEDKARARLHRAGQGRAGMAKAVSGTGPPNQRAGAESAAGQRPFWSTVGGVVPAATEAVNA